MTRRWILGLRKHGFVNFLDLKVESNRDSRLGIGLGVFLLLACNLSSHNVFPDIVLLGQVEEAPDFGRTFGAKALGQNDVSEPGDIRVTLFDDDQTQDGNIRADDTSADGFAATFTSAAFAVARLAVTQQQLDTVREEDTLLHWETLLVVSAGDAENVALPFVAERVSWNFLCDFLVVKDTTGRKKWIEMSGALREYRVLDALSLLIVNVEKFLSPSGGV